MPQMDSTFFISEVLIGGIYLLFFVYVLCYKVLPLYLKLYMARKEVLCLIESR